MMRKALQRNRLIAVILTAAIVLMLLGAGVAKAASIDFAGDDFMILDAKTGDQIGNVHYAVSSPATGHQEVTSFARYNDGTYDVERDDFDTTKGGDLPVMFDYEHTFYKSNGTVFLLIKADFRDGDAVCASYADGEPHALKETLNFPSSTYVGAAMMLPMRQALRQSISNPIELYDFVCIPGGTTGNMESLSRRSGPNKHQAGLRHFQLCGRPVRAGYVRVVQSVERLQFRRRQVCALLQRAGDYPGPQGNHCADDRDGHPLTAVVAASRRSVIVPRIFRSDGLDCVLNGSATDLPPIAKGTKSASRQLHQPDGELSNAAASGTGKRADTWNRCPEAVFGPCGEPALRSGRRRRGRGGQQPGNHRRCGQLNFASNANAPSCKVYLLVFTRAELHARLSKQK